jgi:hypothetical protein
MQNLKNVGVERNPDGRIGPATEMLTGDTDTAMGTAGVAEKSPESNAEHLKRMQSIDINKQILGAQGASELCTLIETRAADHVVTAPHTWPHTPACLMNIQI